MANPVDTSAADLKIMFERVNEDEIRAGRTAVPLSEVEYYSSQIEYIFDFTEKMCDALAKEMSELADAN